MFHLETQRIYHENGYLKEEYTTKGNNKDGLYLAWHTNGQKRIEATYVDGKLNGSYQSWHRNGTKKSEEFYIDGELNGFAQGWYDCGRLEFQGRYSSGKMNGLFKFWDNYIFRIKAEGLYIDGYPEGIHLEYNIIDKDRIGELTIKCYARGNGYWKNCVREVSIKDYVKEQTAKYKEELMKTIYHPDRLDRLAAKAGMETIDYRDLVLPQ